MNKVKEFCKHIDNYMKYRRKLSLLTPGVKAFETSYSELENLYKLFEMKEEQWHEEDKNCQDSRNRHFQCNMTTVIYNGITDETLWDEHDKL